MQREIHDQSASITEHGLRICVSLLTPDRAHPGQKSHMSTRAYATTFRVIRRLGGHRGCSRDTGWDTAWSQAGAPPGHRRREEGGTRVKTKISPENCRRHGVLCSGGSMVFGTAAASPGASSITSAGTTWRRSDDPETRRRRMKAPHAPRRQHISKRCHYRHLLGGRRWVCRHV